MKELIQAFESAFLMDMQGEKRKIFILAGCGKTHFRHFVVIPAEAGIQFFQYVLDSRLRGSDGELEFFSKLLENAATKFTRPEMEELINGINSNIEREAI
jgi:hypothetical protein